MLLIRLSQSGIADASVRRYEQKEVLRAGVPSPQSPSPFFLPPYPLPPTPFDACYAGYQRTALFDVLTILPLLVYGALKRKLRFFFRS